MRRRLETNELRSWLAEIESIKAGARHASMVSNGRPDRA